MVLFEVPTLARQQSADLLEALTTAALPVLMLLRPVPFDCSQVRQIMYHRKSEVLPSMRSSTWPRSHEQRVVYSYSLSFECSSELVLRGKQCDTETAVQLPNAGPPSNDVTHLHAEFNYALSIPAKLRAHGWPDIAHCLAYFAALCTVRPRVRTHVKNLSVRPRNPQ